jgi:hypothetical protein
MRRATAWFLLAALCLPVAAHAADLEVTPKPAPPQAAPAAAPAAPAAPAGGSAFTPPDATCTEWTDGCRTCLKAPAGEITCSNVGLACVQQQPRCTKR